MLPPSAHQISMLSYPSICWVLGLPEDTTSHQADQESSLGVKDNLLSCSLSYTVYSVISSTRSLGIQTRSGCHLLSAVSRTNTSWAETCSPPFLGTLNISWAILASCLLFFKLFLASDLSCSPWPSNSQPNLPLSSDEPMMTTHRWKTHIWEGMHFYGENIPGWQRNWSRRG